MKTLSDYIVENTINESVNLGGLAKTISSKNPDKIYNDVVKFVDSNNSFNPKDVDSLTNGIIVGYLKSGPNFDKFAAVAVANEDEWCILNAHIGRSGMSDVEVEKVEIGDTLYGEWFGNKWSMCYLNSNDDDLLKAILKVK